MTTKPEDNKGIAMRTLCIDFAIKANVGLVYDNDGEAQYSEVEIVNAASKFEAFIKGENAIATEVKKETW